MMGRGHPNAADLSSGASRARLAPYVSHRVPAVRGAKAHSETTRGAFALTLLAGLPEFPDRHVRNNSVEGLRGLRVVAEVALRQIGGVGPAPAIGEAGRHRAPGRVSECGLVKQTMQDPQRFRWTLGNLRARRTSCLGAGGHPCNLLGTRADREEALMEGFPVPLHAGSQVPNNAESL